MNKAIVRRSFLAAGAAVLVSGAVKPACAQRRGMRSAQNLPQGNSEGEKAILSILDEMQRTGATYLSVPVSDGRMLRLLTESTNAKNVVEIGTSTGFSGLWFSMALQKTGGKLTTFEYDSGRAATARANFKKAAVDSLVTVIEGDAHQNVTRLKEPVDVAFIDADKEGYVDYLNKLQPLMRPGGLILAHNVGSGQEYDRAVVSNPALETIFFMDGGGLSITLKKR
jgi:predicted O-methyltransferase YrrM